MEKNSTSFMKGVGLEQKTKKVRSLWKPFTKMLSFLALEERL